MKEKNNGRIKLIVTLINIAIFGFVLIFETLAWMSANDETDSQGMKMEVETSPILVISAKNGSYGEGAFSIEEAKDNVNEAISYNWTDIAKSLQAATHDWTIGTETGLIYSSDPTKVNETTGLSSIKPDNSDLVLEAVPVHTQGIYYYIDYVVYIATLNEKLEGVTSFTVKLTETGDTLASNVFNVYKSTSIDIYMEPVLLNQTITASENNFYGTLCLDNPNVEINMAANFANFIIPKNTEGCLAVLMRCYFDGALTYLDTTVSPSITRCYINSNALKTINANLSFKISFDIGE